MSAIDKQPPVHFLDLLTNKQAFLIIFSVGIFVFFNSLFNDFIWDDLVQIVQNMHIDHLSKIPNLFSHGILGAFYRPIFYSAIATQYALFQNNPFFYHVVQILLHIANSYLLYLLLFHLLKKRLALLLSMIFLVHPMNVEAVVYISALGDPLCVFFGLIALHISQRSKGSLFLVLLASFFIFISMLTKEIGIIFLFIIGFYKFILKKFNTLRDALFLLLPLIVYAYMRFMLANTTYANPQYVPIAQATLLERLYTLPKIIYYYISTFVFPKNLTIAQHWVIKSADINNFALPLLAIIIVFSILIFFGIIIKNSNAKNFHIYVLFCLWILLSFIPYVHILPLDMTVADRWFYLPMMGVVGLTGIIINRYFSSTRHYNLILTILLIVISLFSLRTIIRNVNWYDGATLYLHDSTIDRNNYFLENNVAVILYKNGEYNKALVHSKKSIILNPSWATSWSTTGTIYLLKEDLSNAKIYLKKSIEIDGGNYAGFYYLGETLLYERNYKEAKSWLERGLFAFPDNGPLSLLLSIAEYKLGNRNTALSLIQKAVILNADPQAPYLLQQMNNNEPVVLFDLLTQ